MNKAEAASTAAEALSRQGVDAQACKLPQELLRVTPARLSDHHFVGDELYALSAEWDTSSFSSSLGPQLLVAVEAETECLVCYKAPASFDHRRLSMDSFSFVGDQSKLEIAVCLPLQCALVHQVQGGPSGERRILQLTIPDPKTVPQSIWPNWPKTQPASSAGVWLLECETGGALQAIAEKLQMAGSVMHNLNGQYAIGDLLGLGSFAAVYYAEHRQSGLPVAAKVVHKKAANDAALMKEACMLRRSCHPSVLRFIGFFSGVDPTDGQAAWIIVTEFVCGGELFDRVREKGPLPEGRAASVIKQLLSALKSLHSCGIVHRDIKTENVILVNGECDEVKLVDFGLATPEWDMESMVVRCGTPGYVAPEVLRGEKYGSKVDCFSIGVLLHILLVGHGPFRGKTMTQMLERNMRGTIKLQNIAHLSEEARDFVVRLLSPDPALRPTAAESLKHPWFEKQMAQPENKENDTEVKDLKAAGKTQNDATTAMQRESSFASLAVETDHDARLWSDELVPSIAELRSQTPIFADMQDTIRLTRPTEARLTGQSNKDGRVSERHSDRVSFGRSTTHRSQDSQRRTDRTSLHFTKDNTMVDGIDPMRDGALASPRISLRELAESDVSQSYGGPKKRNRRFSAPEWQLESQQDVFGDSFLHSPRRQATRHTVNAASGSSSGSIGGSAMAVVRMLRPVRSLPSEGSSSHQDSIGTETQVRNVCSDPLPAPQPAPPLSKKVQAMPEVCDKADEAMWSQRQLAEIPDSKPRSPSAPKTPPVTRDGKGDATQRGFRRGLERPGRVFTE